MITGIPAGTRVRSAVTSLLGSTITVASPSAIGSESNPGTCSWKALTTTRRCGPAGTERLAVMGIAPTGGRVSTAEASVWFAVSST
ncbi:hypothetical protein D3C86_1848300 [compost metagenome]